MFEEAEVAEIKAGAIFEWNKWVSAAKSPGIAQENAR
jgi:hypothetical protein